MKHICLFILAALLTGAAVQAPLAEAYKEMDEAHGKEGGKYSKENLKITKEDMQDVMKKYIETKAAGNDGVFKLDDKKAGKIRQLSFTGLHEGLGMSGMGHYSCADFTDLDSGEVLDVDIYVDMTTEGLAVTGVEIHKVDGEPQFIYSKQGRMPADHVHEKVMEGEHKGSAKEEPKGSAYH